MSQRILIDTFNSGLPQPTGIGTYARVLTHAYHDLGNEVFLLTDAPIPRTRGAGPDPKGVSSGILSRADPVLLFDHFSDRPRRPVPAREGPAPWYIRNRFFSLRRLARRLHLLSHVPPIHLVRELDRVEQETVRHRLGHFDGIMNGFSLFERALARFHETRQPTVIDLPVEVDVAHFTWCLPIRARNAKKNIYTMCDLIPLRFPYLTGDEKSSYYDLVRWCCQTADRIVTISEHSRSEIVELMGVPPAKVVTTFLSLDPATEQISSQAEDIASSLHSLFGLKQTEYFLLVGAIEPRKNVARTIAAHLSACPGFPLVICGPKGPQSDAELKLLDNPQLQQHWASTGRREVVVLDYLPRDLVQLLISGARAVLVPSITEGFGLSALEAMTFGTPVIAAKAGGLPEVCGPAAIYVDPYNTDDLRHAIRKMATLGAGELGEFRARARVQAKRFSFASYCARLRDMQASLLG